MKAKYTSTEVKNQPNYTRRMILRAGEKGTGKLLWSCQYWPNSRKSVEQMEAIRFEFEKRNPQIEIVAPEWAE